MFEKTIPKILIIEDNASNHPLFSDVFETEGFKVTIIPFIDENFIEDVVRIHPDIISLDIMIATTRIELPNDGLSLLTLLKKDERTRNIPVMILTNFFEGGKVALAKAEGAVDFINLQGQSVTAIPKIFMRYLEDPKEYIPVHPVFREG